jgi:hypothetical protein
MGVGDEEGEDLGKRRSNMACVFDGLRMKNKLKI